MSGNDHVAVSVNGVCWQSPLATDCSVGDFLEEVRRRYNSEMSCVSSIRVDDRELSERDEAAIALLPVTDLRKIEVTTAHPRELAEDTLQNLIAFTDHLARLSASAGTQFRGGQHPSLELAKLFDGLQTFTEALQNSKRILGIDQAAVEAGDLHFLEVDLFSIAQDLLDSYHDGNQAYLNDLLEKHLPENLVQWRDLGLPMLIRSRDS